MQRVRELRHVVQVQVQVVVRVRVVAHGQVALLEQVKVREPEAKQLAAQVHHMIFHTQVQVSMDQVVVLLHWRLVLH